MGKREKYKKFVLLVTSKIHGIEIILPKALTQVEISHEEFVIINNEKYCRLKRSIRMMGTKREYIESDGLIEHDKKMETDKMIKK